MSSASRRRFWMPASAASSLDLESADGRAQLSPSWPLEATSSSRRRRRVGLAAADLGFDAIRRRNPGLIVVSISPFGLDGPYAQYRATDLTVLAAGGLLALGGYRDTEPLAIHGEQAMLAAGIFGAVAALAALYERDADRQGPVARRLGAGVRRLRARRRDRRMVDPPQRAPRATATGRARPAPASIPARTATSAWWPGRLGTAKAFVALTEWVAESGIRRAARRCSSRNGGISSYRQSPEGIARFAEIFGDVLPHARQAAALPRRPGPADRHRAGQYHRGCAAGPAARREWLFSTRSSTRSLQQEVTFPGPPYRLRARRRGVRARRRGSASTMHVIRELGAGRRPAAEG